jgi:anti-sigma-K factor RskA
VSATDREQLRELASLHALGVLSDEERAELAKAMADDAELAADVRQLEDTAGALGGVVPQVDPPARLRARVLAAAGIEADDATGMPAVSPVGGRRADAPVVVRKSSALPGWLAAAAALVLASGLGLWALQLRTSLDDMNARVERAEAEVVRIQRTLDVSQQQTKTLEARNEVLFAPDMQRVDLAGQPVAPASTARAFVSRHSGLAFAANQLPTLPADKVYQVWVIPQGQSPVDAGLLSPDASGHASLFFKMPADMAPAAVIAVTVEPRGGVPAPTGDKALVGEVAATAASAG